MLLVHIADNLAYSPYVPRVPLSSLHSTQLERRTRRRVAREQVRATATHAAALRCAPACSSSRALPPCTSPDPDPEAVPKRGYFYAVSDTHVCGTHLCDGTTSTHVCDGANGTRVCDGTTGTHVCDGATGTYVCDIHS